MLADCLLENLPLILAAVGIVMLGIIVAAVLVVLVTWSGGTATAFAAAVAAVLADWWVSIAASVLGTLALAVQLCLEQEAPAAPAAAPPAVVGQPLIISGLTLALTVIAITHALRRAWKPKPKPRKGAVS